MAIKIRPLQKTDKRDYFCCGHPDLDLFFHRFASQNQFRHHIGVTYVAMESNIICGYVTVAAGNLERELLTEPKTKLPSNYPPPILRLGRLAVDKKFQGKGIGKMLLRYTFLLAQQQKIATGCIGILVDAKKESVSFYENYGFQFLGGVLEGELRGHPNPSPMFLSIKSIPDL